MGTHETNDSPRHKNDKSTASANEENTHDENRLRIMVTEVQSEEFDISIVILIMIYSLCFIPELNLYEFYHSGSFLLLSPEYVCFGLTILLGN